MAIERHGRRADERRELSRRASPHEIHLEEALLAVNEAERAGEIEASFALERGNSLGVPPDMNRSLEPFETQRSIGRGQTRSQEHVGRATRHYGEHEEEPSEPLHPPHGF